MLDARSGRRLMRYNSDPLHYTGLPDVNTSVSSDDGTLKPDGINHIQPMRDVHHEDARGLDTPRAIHWVAATADQSFAQPFAGTQLARPSRSFSTDSFDSSGRTPSLQTWSSYSSAGSSNTTDSGISKPRTAAPTFSKNPFRTPTQEDVLGAEIGWRNASRPRSTRSHTTPGAYDRNPFQLHGHIKQASNDLRLVTGQQIQRPTHKRGRTEVSTKLHRRDRGWCRPVPNFKSFSEGDAQTGAAREVDSPPTPGSTSSTQTCPAAWQMQSPINTITSGEATSGTMRTIMTQKTAHTPESWDWNTQYCLPLSTSTFPRRTLSLGHEAAFGLSDDFQNQWPGPAATLTSRAALPDSDAGGFNGASDDQSTDKAPHVGLDSSSTANAMISEAEFWQGMPEGIQVPTSSSIGLDSSNYFVASACLDSGGSDMCWTGSLNQPQAGSLGTPEQPDAGHPTSAGGSNTLAQDMMSSDGQWQVPEPFVRAGAKRRRQM